MTLCVTIATNLTNGLLINYTRIGSAFNKFSENIRVYPRSAPRVISAQNLILTHINPDFRAFGRTRGAYIYLPLGPCAISPLTKMLTICHIMLARMLIQHADLFPHCRDHFVRNATRLRTAPQRVPLLRRRYPATDSVSNHPFGLNIDQ